jgi:hypothetical protein
LKPFCSNISALFIHKNYSTQVLMILMTVEIGMISNVEKIVKILFLTIEPELNLV